MKAPLDRPCTFEELRTIVGKTVNPSGLGGEEAVRLWAEAIAPACLSTDHPRYLSFVPSAPSKAAAAFDMLVGATSIYGGSWLEGSGAAYAENQALEWIVSLTGMPTSAGGVFVQGGTIGNLSALVAARERARAKASAAARADARAAADGEAAATTEKGEPQRRQWAVCVTGETRSSVKHALHTVMDADVIEIPGDERGRMVGATLRATVEALPAERREAIMAVVATAGTTNLGVVDDIAGVANVAAETADGCTLTAPMGELGWSRPARGTCSAGWNEQIRSSSTRTSGCSPRSTRAR